MIDIVVTFPIKEKSQEKILLIHKCQMAQIKSFRINLAKVDLTYSRDEIEDCIEIIRNNIENSNLIFDIPYPGNYPRVFFEKDMHVHRGEQITMYAENVARTPYINVRDLTCYFKKGGVYYYNNGISSLSVQEVEKTKICFKVESNETKFLTSKSISAERRISNPFLENIKSYILDFLPDKVWCSFVETSEELQSLKKFCVNDVTNRIKVCCKVETERGCKHIKQLARNYDEIIIARGDLGINLKPTIFLKMQKEIIQECIAMNTPVYVATDILRSMGKYEMPNRAELTDLGWLFAQNINGLMLNVSSLYSDNFLQTIKLIRDFE